MSISKVRKIIHQCNDELKPLNILTFPTHERYETQLCKTGHNFYSLEVSGGKTWNSEQTVVPENYNIVNSNNFPSYIDFDLMLVHSKISQYSMALKINDRLGLPIVVADHIMPTSNFNKQHIQQINNMVGNINVYISEKSKKAWNSPHPSIVINHGIDSTTFCNRKEKRVNNLLTIANDFINRDYCLNFTLWKEVTKEFETTLRGDTQGLSTAAKSTEELVDEYNKHSVYLNTTNDSPIPMSLLEAMSCGCAVVSSATCMIPEVIKNGINGFISNDAEELKGYIQTLLDNPDQARKLGEEARKTIINMFSENLFIDRWNQVFQDAKDII
tara:strand:- start:725 stop:1711 length:987 start_codon:yes stop_codon:yes gene_type:complete